MSIEGNRNKAGQLIDISQVAPNELRRTIVIRSLEKYPDQAVKLEPVNHDTYRLCVRPRVTKEPADFEWQTEIAGTLDFIWGML